MRMRRWKRSIPWKNSILWKNSTPTKSIPGNRILAGIGLLSLVLAAVLCNVPRAQAALRVDMEERGALALRLPADDDSAGMAMDMARIKGSDGTADGELDVHAWKLADMLETGKYRLSEEFGNLSVTEDGWQEMSVSEDGWKNLSAAAMALIYELDEEGNPVGEPRIPATYESAVHVGQDGSIAEPEAFADMDLGLYLIVVDEAKSPKYTYTFTPMIISLPWSLYQYDGTADDTWQYTREAVLKPAQELRYGSIRITKELTEYNASQGDATFVFDVVARESADEDAEIVYSNVVSLTFSAVGIQEVVLEHIPAEAVVTVTEVYSGANCQITVSDDESKSVIAYGEDGGPITFSFENEYDEDSKSGYGVENRFRYDTEQNTYQWTTDRQDIGGTVAESEAGAER